MRYILFLLPIFIFTGCFSNQYTFDLPKETNYYPNVNESCMRVKVAKDLCGFDVNYDYKNDFISTFHVLNCERYYTRGLKEYRDKTNPFRENPLYKVKEKTKFYYIVEKIKG